MRAGERREHLLATAAELVGKRGWEALGMVPLAEAAGVSRQLIYEHFENVDALSVQVTHYLFDEVARATSEALERHPDDLRAAIESAARSQFELPRSARLALRELASGPGGRSRALQRLRTRIRRHIGDLWAPRIRRHAGVGEPEARAVAWTMSAAAWGLVDLIDDGVLSPAEAVDLYVKTSLGAIEALEPK
jgi:AcrR family transcriptional regulator